MGRLKNVPFGHLHVHSEYSLKDSPARIEALVNKSLDLGMNFLAITEHGNMHSAVEFYKACIATTHKLIYDIGLERGIQDDVLKEISQAIPNKMSMKQALRDVPKIQEFKARYPELIEEVASKEVKPIFGVEAYVIPFEWMLKSDDKEMKNLKHHLVILAKDNIGYSQLMKAVSKSYLYQHKSTQSVFPRMTYKLMSEVFEGGHVIALSSCIQGEIPKLILENKYEEAKEKALFYQSIFGEGNFYIELQNHGLDDELDVLPSLIKISEEMGIPLVATNDVHYVDKEDARVRDMMVAMRFRTSVDDIDKDCEELYMKSYEEMLELFRGVPEAVHNAIEIGKRCSVELKKEKRFPKYDVPNGMSEEEYLTKLANKGIYKRFPDFGKWQEKHKRLILDRMDTELEVINKLHYAGYHLIVQDFINEGKKIGMVGPGRGSAVGSLVCYLIGITDVNPLKYDLIFERFLNEERVSDPDIDTDFDSHRDEVIEYVRKRYGESSVCNIVTFGTLAAKASIRAAGRANGLELFFYDKIAKTIPNRPGITIREALEESSDLKRDYETNQDVKELIDDALLLEGLAVQTGVHAAGVIIADRDVSDYIPMMYDIDKDIWVTQFDMTECEADVGLLKMDFLGLENLTIINRTFRNIEKNYSRKLTLSDIDINNAEEVERVMGEIFCQGKTRAVFQFESSGMRELLRRFQPSSIEDLILLNAAYRPGPIQYLDEIIDVKHKRKKPRYICPQMESILGLTYGKPIYQEQIMRMFNEIGGFSLGEADIIRRAMSKKKYSEMEKYLPQFKRELVRAGATQKDAEKFCEELMDFANYAFNKSHSAAYALLAYYTAWLKCFYPKEYMANVLNSASTEKTPLYIKECKDMDIEVLPPSINESGRYFTVTSNGAIRFGIEGIKYVKTASGDILEEREANDEFLSFEDFTERMVDVNSRAVWKREMESLIYTGALDEFGLNRRQMIEGRDEYVKNLKEYKKKLENPKSRPATIERWRKRAENPRFDMHLQEFDKNMILEKEKELIGFYASGHPLDDYEEVITEKADAMTGDLSEEDDGRYITLVGQINDFTPLYKKSDGTPMGKFVLEDLTGEVDCICFTRAYAENKENIKEQSVVAIRGRVMAEVEKDPETGEVTRSDLQVAVEKVKLVKYEQRMYIKLDNIFEWTDKARDIFVKYPGRNRLIVYFKDEKQVYEAKQGIRSCRELKKELYKMFGEGSFTSIRRE